MSLVGLDVNMKLFELAHNRKEAEELAAAEFGYETRTAAEKARRSPDIDTYYRSLMKVYEVTVPDSTAPQLDHRRS